MQIGYMRASSESDRQTTDLRRDALLAAGVPAPVRRSRLLSGRGTNLGALTHPRINSAQSWESRPQTLALGCIGQDGTNMLACEAWEISKDLTFGRPTGEVLKNIAWGEAGSDKRRLPAAHDVGSMRSFSETLVFARKGIVS